MQQRLEEKGCLIAATCLRQETCRPLSPTASLRMLLADQTVGDSWVGADDIASGTYPRDHHTYFVERCAFRDYGDSMS